MVETGNGKSENYHKRQTLSIHITCGAVLVDKTSHFLHAAACMHIDIGGSGFGVESEIHP
jgi:hypothetical protein